MEMGIEERNIYVEKKSGHDFNREVYDMLVNHIMRKRNRLTVTELKRFGRSNADDGTEGGSFLPVGKEVELTEIKHVKIIRKILT